VDENSKPDPLHVLLGMRDFLADYCADAKDFMARCLATPAPESRLARSLRASLQDGVYTVAWQYLLVGVDHLEALVQTLQGTPETLQIPQAACFTLERGCLESSSFAVWLLDPTVPEDVSVSRGLMARVRNLYERQKIGANDKIRDDALRQIASVARAHGLRIEQKGIYPTKIGPTSKPQATDVCGDALALIHSPGKDYRSVYQILSGYAHGLGYALSLNITTWQTVGQLKLGTIVPPVESILLRGLASARVHHKALEMLGHHTGLDDVPPSVSERTDDAWF
jgi:hypothetical protein